MPRNRGTACEVPISVSPQQVMQLLHSHLVVVTLFHLLPSFPKAHPTQFYLRIIVLRFGIASP